MTLGVSGPIGRVGAPGPSGVSDQQLQNDFAYKRAMAASTASMVTLSNANAPAITTGGYAGALSGGFSNAGVNVLSAVPGTMVYSGGALAAAAGRM